MRVRTWWKRFTRADLRVLPSNEAYALWAHTYAPSAHNPLMAAEEAVMRGLLPDIRGAAVLDLACGTGRYARLAQAEGAAVCVAVDSSAAMLRAGRAAGDGTVRPLFGQADLAHIPLAARSVDLVLCGLALGHVPRLAPPLHEIARVLKPGGSALVSDFHPFLALSGRQRSFTAPDGRAFAVEHYPHLYSDYHSAAHAASLVVDAIAEPRLNLAGDDVPAVLVLRLRRS